jgi:hypothetical protein
VRSQLKRLSIVLVAVLSSVLALVSMPATSHAAPVRVQAPAASSPHMSNPALGNPQLAAEVANAPIVTVTAADAQAMGFPPGTQLHAYNPPTCLQPTAQLRKEALAGKLTAAQMSAYGFPTLQEASGSKSLWTEAIENNLHRDCTIYRQVSGAPTNGNLSSSQTSTTSSAKTSTKALSNPVSVGCVLDTTANCWEGEVETDKVDGSYNTPYEVASATFSIPAAVFTGWACCVAKGSTWIGLGGVNGDLFQDGTDITEDWVNSIQTDYYNSFVEITPDLPYPLGALDYNGHEEAPGNHIYAWVNKNYQYEVEDISTGDTKSGTFTGGEFDLSTYECINEETGATVEPFVWMAIQDNTWWYCDAINENTTYVFAGTIDSTDTSYGLVAQDPTGEFNMYYPWSTGPEPGNNGYWVSDSFYG